MKKYSRKQFIHMGAAASAALLLGSCGLGSSGSKPQNPTATGATDIDHTPPPHHTDTTLDLVHKDDPRYDALRQGFNKRIDKHPEVIALCKSTEEVAAAVQYAIQHHLPIAIKSGGHSMEGFSCNDGGMVINLSKLNHAELLSGDRIRVGPGCLLRDLYNTILPHGRILPAGSCGSVGVGGLALGGGYGLFGRKYGFTCDHLLDATMVDGKGNIHYTIDDAELLWALKGGGTGNFGIVTEMTFTTHPAPTQLQAHYFKARKLTAERAAAILRTWMELTPQLPPSYFSGYVLNGSTLNILVTNYEPEQDAPQLHQLASVMDEYHASHVNPLDTMLHNYYGRPGPLNFRNSSAGFFNTYTDLEPYISQVFDKIIATPGMIYQLNTMGGKIKDPIFAQTSSYPHRAFDFLSELQAYWDAPAQGERTAAATKEILNITEQHGITRQYVNYCSLEFDHWEQAYYGDNYPRLQAIKHKYDPDNNIRHPQSVRV